MAFLELKNIGKIYVSEGNVAVGIRGVNATFEKGEFVAITGASGSGKSTLLNVISGMDSYEEGELYIEGHPTSHYVQAEWEEYRKEYISFIFADYNILESFTVLQNVEMALMHIDDTKERKRRALELIDRVGLTPWLKHKGSKLSGGQKQRTVIARALAKDSPIILADEPTGNLDSETSKEIIALLKEVSQDKLLIVVTHNFDQVEQQATRHIRIFDGAVESDKEMGGEVIAPAMSETENEVTEKKELLLGHEDRKTRLGKMRTSWKNACILGKALLWSKPKLTIFLGIVMIVASLGIFLDCAMYGANMMEAVQKSTVFRKMDGRVVIAPQDGTEFTEKTIKQWGEETGAKKVITNDSLLETTQSYIYISTYNGSDYDDQGYEFIVVMDKDYGTPDVGHYPEKRGEVFLYLPLGAKTVINKNTEYDIIAGATVAGVKYFVDNRKTAEIMMTGETYDSLCGYMNESYKQASLIYENDSEAKAAVEVLRSKGLYASTTEVTRQRDIWELLEVLMTFVFAMFTFVLGIIMLVLLVNLITKKSIRSLRPDVAILRSMGIPTDVVKKSMYIRMMLTLIPGVLAIIVMQILMAVVPRMNRMFTFLTLGQYLLIIVALLAFVFLLTRKQIQNLFDESVRKTLRGGADK